MFSASFQRLRAWLNRRAVERDFADELQDHLARDIEFRVRQGTARDEARRAALATLGGVGGTTDALRDAHGLTSMDDLRRDLIYASRRLRRSPGYALLVIGTIGLGVGAATAVFSAVDGVLLKPLPFRDPARLVTLWQTKPSVGLERDDVAPRVFLDWVERTRSYTHVAAGNPYSVNYRARDRTETVEAWQVSEGFFPFLEARPRLGRTLRREDFQPGGAPVVVVDHDFWQAKLGGDPAIVGASLTLDARPHTVVGVMPPGFTLPDRSALWMPWVPDSSQRDDRFGTYLKVYGRLKEDVSLEGAQAELTRIAAQLEREFPRSNTGVGARVIPLRDVLIGGRAALLWTLLGASALLLLVTVANVSALHLTRLGRHRREAAIRAALGAQRGRLARPVLAEGLLLAMCGGAFGIGAGWLGVRIIHALGPADLPRLHEIALDRRAVALALVLALASGVVLGLMSLGRLKRVSAESALGSRTTTGTRGSMRTRRVAVGAQLALAMVLLVGSGLLVRSFVAVLNAERGYRTDHLLSFTTWVYGEYPRREALQQFVRGTIERLEELPGVAAVAMSSALPLADGITGERADIVMDGAAVVEGEEPQSRGVVVWPSYFTTLGIGLRRGRALTAVDDERGEGVVVVNEAFVRRFSPDREVVGRMVGVGLMSRQRPRRVVGVVADTRDGRLDGPPEPVVYIPWLQQPLAALTFVVRTANDPAALMPMVPRTMFQIDPRVGIARLATLEQLVEAHVRERRFLLLLLGAFAASAVLLACVGVAGLMGQTVVERSREIGVRMALGATPAAIRGELLGEALRMAGIGLGAGGLAALAAAQLLSRFLYLVSPRDLTGFAMAAGLLGTLTVLAALGPSLRATRLDPSRVLQEG